MLLCLVLLSGQAFAQTMLYPGDIAVLSIASDMEDCGLSPLSDEIAFICFADIETGTEIDLTDNGWEFAFANYFGDSEGTLRMTRTGGTIPRGTVITLQSQFIGGNWTYRTVTPDNGWTIVDLNAPSGHFNIDPNGDQILFMQGGTWDNQGGGGIHRALYTGGRMLFGANMEEVWAADGTVHHSNLPDGLAPCYAFVVSSGLTYHSFLKYIGPLDEATHFEWLDRFTNTGFYNTMNTCNDYLTYLPFYPPVIPISDAGIGVTCAAPCMGCAPYEAWLIFSLPEDGVYDVTYTDGTDTFFLEGVMDGAYGNHTLMNTTEFSIISVQSESGCPVYSNFGDPTEIPVLPELDPGLPNTIWACEEMEPGWLDLNYWLGGNPSPGGIWLYAGGELADGIWYPALGEGLFTYYVSHGQGANCIPPFDSASITINFIDLADLEIEVSCDQNGTPTDITDDRAVLIITVPATYFPAYKVKVLGHTVSPLSGFSGEPVEFILEPGSATAQPLHIVINELGGLGCEFEYVVEAPGFCSDPCDADMTSVLQGPPEDLCVYNCPEIEYSLTLDVEDGTPPYYFAFTLSTPGYPQWSFPQVAFSGYDNHEMRICIDSVSAPTLSAGGTLLTLPSSLAGESMLFTLGGVYDKYDCTSILDGEELVFTIHERPDITTDSLDFCRYEALDVDLTEYDLIVSPFLEVQWFDGDPFFGGEKINSPTGVNLENIVDLWAYVEDDYCGNSIRVPFVILPTPDLDSLAPVNLCSGQSIQLSALPVVDAGNSMATYTYHSGLPADTSTMLDPMTFIPADSMTVYVLATAGRCTDIVPVQLNVEDYPVFALDALPCDIPSSTYSILFTSDADSIAASAGVIIHHPVGQDSVVMIPNDTSVTLVIYNATGLCTDTFQITAPNCNCPTIAQPVPVISSAAICTGDVIPTFTVTTDPGLVVNWYNQPSGGTLLASNTLSYTPPAGGNYYAEALDPTTSCTSLRTPVTLTIHPVADLAPLADPVRCAGETIDLSLLQPGVTNGVAGTGQWFDLQTMQPVGGLIPVIPGSVFQYVFTSTGGCLSYDTIEPVVHPLPTLNVDLVDCDEIALLFTIGFTTDATLVVVNAGTLVHVTGTDSFRVEDVPFDTDLVFMLTNETTTCSSTVMLDAPDCSCPPMLQSDNVSLCSSTGSFDLSGLENPGINGTWTIVSTPPGSQPATLSGTVLDISNADPGAYRMLFIRSVILDNCIDSAFADIVLTTSPAADAGIDGASCAPDVIVLSGVPTGSNPVILWQTTGTGILQSPNAASTNYTPSLADIQAGALSFTFTVNDPTGTCPAASETIDWVIDGDAYYQLQTTPLTFCDTATGTFDLDQLITFGTTAGQWFFIPDIPGAITGGSVLVHGTVPSGTQNVYYAPLSANPPCTIDTTAVSLVIRNCECPSVALATPPDGLCSASGTIDLSTLQITGEPGQWSIAATPAGIQPATLNGNFFTTANSDPGLYTLRFTLTNPVAGCDDFAEVAITVSPTPVLGIQSTRCAPDLQSWEAVIQSTASAIVLSDGMLSTLGGGMYQVTGLSNLQDLVVTVNSDDGFCSTQVTVPFADCACTLSVDGVPASVDLCPGEDIALTGQVHDPKGAFEAYWSAGTDTTRQATITIDAPGIYVFTAEDELGCISRTQVTVSVYPELSLSVSTSPVTCPGFSDGVISIDAIGGGVPPFAIAINGGNFVPVTNLPVLFNDLAAGNYTIAVMDAASCMFGMTAVVDPAAEETLSLGEDQVILVGDSADILPFLSFVPDTFYWAGDLEGIDPLALNQRIWPETDRVIRLTGVDEHGCIYTDELRIRVLLTSRLDVPNVFSPNDDGINDLLAPSFDPSITRINYFEIYDRWGELVFEARDYVPGAIAGWDGRFHGKQLQPGVFLYRVEAVNKRKQVLQRSGDLTLLR